MDVNPGCFVSPDSRAAALCDPVILTHGVVETVEHPAGFVQAADESVVAIWIPNSHFRKIWLVKPQPVHRWYLVAIICKVVRIILAYLVTVICFALFTTGEKHQG